MNPTSEKRSLGRLTALWAFAESGLGGVMHALHLPLTGIFIGGFAVLIVGMIAHISDGKRDAILKATLIVLAVKGIVSPHTPPTAYLAVAFQGLLGAALGPLLVKNLAIAIFYGVVSMLESAFQKVLVLYIFLGKNFFQTLDGMIADFAHSKNDIAWSHWIFGAYVGLYFVWGICLGIWIRTTPKKLGGLYAAYKDLPKGEEKRQTKNVKRQWVFPLVLLGITIGLYFLPVKGAPPASKALLMTGRTLLVLLCWYFVLVPIFAHAVQRWLKPVRGKYAEEIRGSMAMLPSIWNTALALFEKVREEKKGLAAYSKFAFALIALVLYSKNEP